jgi:copper transport protein
MNVSRTMRSLLLAASGIMVAAGALWAHAALVRSVPAKDARLTDPPPVVVLEFNENVDPATSRVTLVGPAGDSIPLAPRRAADSSARMIEADVPPLPAPGSWRLEWRLIGADGHPVTGRYSFHVDSIPDRATRDTVPATAETDFAGGDATAGGALAATLFGGMIRLMVILSIISIIGAAVVAMILIPQVDAALPGPAGTIADPARARLGAIVRLAAWAMLVLALVRIVRQAAALAGSVGGVALSDVEVIVRHTRWGTGWILQVVAALLVLVATRGGRGALAVHTRRWQLVAIGAVLFASGASAMGHPAAVPEAPFVAMGLDAVHALAAGAWVGGLAAITVALLPFALALPDALRVDAVRATLRAFSPIALGAAGALVVTGLIGGWWQLRGDPAGLLTTSYGRLLLAKVGAVAVVATLGAWHWRVARPRLDRAESLSGLRSSMRVELAVMAIVIMLTAVLTGTAPGGPQ